MLERERRRKRSCRGDLSEEHINVGLIVCYRTLAACDCHVYDFDGETGRDRRNKLSRSRSQQNIHDILERRRLLLNHEIDDAAPIDNRLSGVKTAFKLLQKRKLLADVQPTEVNTIDESQRHLLKKTTSKECW